jgi:hypothetical protein
MSIDNTYDGNASARFGHQSFDTDITESSLSSAVFAASSLTPITTPENSFSSDEQHKSDYDGDSLIEDEEEGREGSDQVGLFSACTAGLVVCEFTEQQGMMGLPYPPTVELLVAELIETLVKCTQALLRAVIRFPRFEVKLASLNRSVTAGFTATGNPSRSSVVFDLSNAIREASDLFDDILSSSEKYSERGLKLWRQEEETLCAETEIPAAARSPKTSSAACKNKRDDAEVLNVFANTTGRTFSGLTVQQKKDLEWRNASLKRLELQSSSFCDELAHQAIMFVESLCKMKETQDEMKEDISGMKESQEEIKKDIVGMKKDISELKESQEEMQKDIVGMKESQEEMQKDISELKESQEEMKKDILGIKKDISGMKETQEEMKLLLQAILGAISTTNTAASVSSPQPRIS